jgi:DNA-binding transcriptional regulator YhcF (GntR family)
MEFSNHKSIFRQIADNITDKVLNGTYAPGEKIPSVREQAMEMGVNPNTIMRTYTELQAENIIDNRRGVGFFVNEGARAHIFKKRKAEFYSQVIPEFLRQASLVGISEDELVDHFKKLKQKT